MERDLDWKFVMEGNPSIPLFPLVSGENPDPLLNPLPLISTTTTFSDPPTQTFSTFFNTEDVVAAFNHHHHHQQQQLQLQRQLPDYYNSSSSSFQDPQLFNLVSETIKMPQTHEPFDFFCTNSLPDFHSLDSSPPPKRPCFDSNSLQSFLDMFNVVPNFTNPSSSSSSPLPPPPANHVVSRSDMVRQRRQSFTDRTRYLREVVPWDTKMGTATLLEETHKYVKFLQAQIKALQSMPSFEIKDVGGAGASAHHVFDVSGVYGALGSLSRQQFLQFPWNSPVVQTWLSSQGCCLFSLEQLLLLKQDADRKAALERVMFRAARSS